LFTRLFLLLKTKLGCENPKRHCFIGYVQCRRMHFRKNNSYFLLYSNITHEEKNMKRKITTMIIMLVLLVSATTTITWSDTYTNDNGNKTLGSRGCGLGSGQDWDVVSWVDSSSNTTNCVDKIKCRSSTDNTNFGAYTSYVDSGSDLGLTGRYVQCVWELNPTNMVESNCTLSGLGIMCSNAFTDVGEGMPQIGSDVGSFLTNMAPGVGGFIIIIGIFAGVGMIVYAIVNVVKGKIKT